MIDPLTAIETNEPSSKGRTPASVCVETLVSDSTLIGVKILADEVLNQGGQAFVYLLQFIPNIFWTEIDTITGHSGIGSENRIAVGLNVIPLFLLFTNTSLLVEMVKKRGHEPYIVLTWAKFWHTLEIYSSLRNITGNRSIIGALTRLRNRDFLFVDGVWCDT